jgi:hypothetical protein
MTSLDAWLKMMSPRSLDDFPTKRLEDYVHLRALPAGWSWFQWFLLGGASHSVNVSKKSSYINGDIYIYVTLYNQLYTYIHGYVIYGNMDIYIYIIYIKENNIYIYIYIYILIINDDYMNQDRLLLHCSAVHAACPIRPSYQ